MSETTYEIRWCGATGWVGHDYGKGALLPPYASACTLTEAAQGRERHSRNPMIRQRPCRHGGGPRAYDQATREAVRALRQDGLTLQVIAQRFRIPVSTVYNIVTK